jgi:15-hydroxyprostaglandin dehydrogenase (NAD)
MAKLVAIVTGEASGIGLGVTCHLLSRGYRVVIADMMQRQPFR